MTLQENFSNFFIGGAIVTGTEPASPRHKRSVYVCVKSVTTNMVAKILMSNIELKKYI